MVMISKESLNDLFRNHTIKKLVTFVNSQEIDALAPYRCAQHRYDMLNTRLQAFKCVYSQDEAVSMRRDSFPLVSQPIQSIPFGIKDVFNTTLRPTGMGSTIWDNFEAGNNARCVDSLLRMGALPFGKTITAEFAVHALNETVNPYDITRTPGTSSSGSAVAVAAGIVPFAIGTQTAASIIRPASFCGVWGMKPSFGLIPRTGSLKTTDSLDTIGFFSFFASDLRRILSSIRVKGPNYPYVYSHVDKRGPLPKLPGELWRVGLFKSAFWKTAQPDIKDAIKKFAAALQGDSYIDVEAIPDYFGTDVHSDHEVIYDKSLSYYFEQEALAQDQISELMSEAIASGSKISLAVFNAALDRQSVLIENSRRLFAGVDVVISLSTSTSAPLRHELELPDPSLIWTFLGMPAINVPIGLSENGLPIGLQLTAKKYDDYLLLQFIDYVLSLGLLRDSSITLASSC